MELHPQLTVVRVWGLGSRSLGITAFRSCIDDGHGQLALCKGLDSSIDTGMLAFSHATELIKGEASPPLKLPFPIVLLLLLRCCCCCWYCCYCAAAAAAGTTATAAAAATAAALSLTIS
jgi:hypothetical protein